MERLIEKVLHVRWLVIIIFTIATVICLIASKAVVINYDIMDYLPDESPSTVALDVMDEEYEKAVPNLRVMVPNVTVPEAAKIKEKIKNVSGVDDITWLDDAANIYEPIEYIDKDLSEDYYKDGNALYTVTVNDDKKIEAMHQIREIVGDNGALSGSVANTVTAIEGTEKEISRILVFVVILVFIILALTTESWFEPVLFLTAIGIAIAINKGTDLFFGTISFVTNSAGSILQLAVSMDYSIFLIHRFQECRRECPDVKKAMSKAVMLSVGSITSSGLTTVMGFAALIVMKFKIGQDMGIIMTKAILISLFTVLAFLPSLTICSYKLIDKTHHRMLVPSFDKLAWLVNKIKLPVLVSFFVILIPCFLAQSSNEFIYGQEGIYGEGTQLGDDIAKTEEVFGKSNQMALMVRGGSPALEKKLCNELLQTQHVSSLVSYAETVGVEIPVEFVPKNQISQLISKDYSRIIITVDTSIEGEEAFKTVERVRAAAQKYYPNDYHLAGESVNSYDLRDVVTNDNKKVNFLAIASIALILLLNFKSISLPIILLFVIETSIWINLSCPYFADSKMYYIGYLIISSIQLGATVDYTILFADRYNENRQKLLPSDAMKQTIRDTMLSILTSAGILMLAGFMLAGMSTHQIISQLGTLVGRGGMLSAILVVFVLPPLIMMSDGIVRKTTIGLKYLKK